MIMHCEHCGGEGRKYKSRYGGNDPDVWDAGECEFCEGSGNQKCESRGCDEDAVAFNEDGEAALRGLHDRVADCRIRNVLSTRLNLD